MIILRRIGGNHFLLMKTLLRQQLRNVPGYSYRQVKRSQLAKVFQQYIAYQSLDGQYSGWSWEKDSWIARVYVDGTMEIGCQHFDAEETAKIRRWALAKRRKK